STRLSGGAFNAAAMPRSSAAVSASRGRARRSAAAIALPPRHLAASAATPRTLPAAPVIAEAEERLRRPARGSILAEIAEGADRRNDADRDLAGEIGGRRIRAAGSHENAERQAEQGPACRDDDVMHAGEILGERPEQDVVELARIRDIEGQESGLAGVERVAD